MQTAKILEFTPKEVVRVAEIENGYTRISNELLEKIISFPFTLRQQKVVLSIIRKTDGYNKKTDWIGNKQLAEMTGYVETRCSTIKNELIKMNVLITNGREYGINKNINEWKLYLTQNGKTFTKTGKENLPKSVNQSLPKEVNTKDNITKENKNIKEKIFKKEISPKPVKTPFPENLIITESNQKLASELGLNAEFEFGKFRDRNLAVGGKYINWHSAFSGWLRKAYEFKHGGKKPSATVQPKKSGMTPERQREYDQYLFMNGLT